MTEALEKEGLQLLKDIEHYNIIHCAKEFRLEEIILSIHEKAYNAYNIGLGNLTTITKQHDHMYNYCFKFSCLIKGEMKQNIVQADTFECYDRLLRNWLLNVT